MKTDEYCKGNILETDNDCEDLPEAEEEGGDADEDDAEVEKHNKLAKMIVMLVMMLKMMMMPKNSLICVSAAIKAILPSIWPSLPLSTILNKHRHFATGGLSKELDSPASNN